ncbi:piezo-type mechanosensitive ion channel component 1 isoform X5 [Cimex lectularius]|uniref:Piezo-type mechanosensitive ion channel component n=1 Tax=Cimex lectularius TaxID=79782 RepID=A0A8I6TK69_CIMLE|nr:piezo-type mechanosensitive ion channel component 1 isoform X5 [Cimex lectularius]
MTRWVVSFLLQGFVLPLAFLSGIILRQNGQSFLYLILLFINPTVPVPTVKSMFGWTGFYQKFVLCVTIINMLSSFAFQLVLISNPPYGHLVEPPCSSIERYLRYAGLVRLDKLDFLTLTCILSPDIIILATTLIVHASCKSLNPWLFEEQLLPISEPHSSEPDQAAKLRTIHRVVSIGKYMCLMVLCFAGIIRPCVFNAVYFISFLVIMTLWGYNKHLGKTFAYFCRCLVIFIAGHLCLLFLYQMQWAQELLPSDSSIPRYLGLISLVKKYCSDPRVYNLVWQDWDFFANPFILVILYYILYYEANLIINNPDDNLKEAGMTRQLSTRLSQKGKLLRNQTNRWRSATRKVRDPSTSLDEASAPMALTETTPLTSKEVYWIPCLNPLIRGRESVLRKHGRKGVIDTLGNVTITEVPEPSEEKMQDEEKLHKGAGEIIELKQFRKARLKKRKKDTVSICEAILNVILSALQLIAKSSYLAANISMMAWSITYHSWLTFILLLWASILWLVPNQRKAMYKSSPFLVLYALGLLIAQYIYGMNLTESELPQTVSGLNLKQIGFEKVAHYPIKPLTIKILYTLLFWITLRQHNQQKWEARNKTAMADIASPFHLGLGPAAMPSGATSKTSAFVDKFGSICRGILTKFWIWVVACILFAIGIAGERITIIRIVYMSMALLFILTFQLNWSMWRNMMYSFWLVLIIYSMIILVVTYTYQFDNFDKYWEEYLKVPVRLQKDIGLERFDTKELFVKLLTPTLFVIITVLQVHYFHNDFLEISDIKSRGTSIGRKPSGGPFDIVPLRQDGDKRKTMLKPSFLRRCSKIVNFIWLFLELHLLKLVLISIMLLAANDVCAVHLSLVILIVIGVLLNTSMQIMITHICSSIVSALIILKMVYQINYISHSEWDVHCDEVNTTRNSAEWVGFRKAAKGETLPFLLKGYIGVLIIITVHAVVLRRQKFHRHLQGRQLFRPLVMFPKITHSDVDKDVPHFIKYMMNYGFYRFGVELSLISIVTLIGVRMDFYAVLYSLILCFLITPNRKKLSKLWPFLTLFIVVTIPLQYSLAVGVPPVFCIEYPWNQSDTLQRMKEWMFFPDHDDPPEAYKLICDFLVLMFVSRQALVFNIEKRHRHDTYIGGSNKPVLHAFDEKDFVNPVPDFFSVTKSVLDVLKRILFAASFWICLALVFLAGTNRVNIFSLGYLIGAFIFLWQGNDLYLRPIKTILVWWNSLLAYNVGIIFAKALFQIIGCIFITTMKTQACWMIQLFGIACIQKFESGGGGILPSTTFEPTECVVPRTEVGLAWDGCCFAMLLLQRRLFSSHYFMRMIDEAKAMAILASRGAELIEDLSNKQVEFQRESEKQLLEKIKGKMDRIKASQKKLHGPNYQEPENHHKVFDDKDEDWFKNYYHHDNCNAIRSGDYFMFDDYDEDLDLISELSVASFTTTLSDENVDLKRTSVTQLITTALKTDVKTAINEAAATNLKPREEYVDVDDEGKPGPSGMFKRKKKMSIVKSSSFGSDGLLDENMSRRRLCDENESDTQVVSDRTEITSAGDEGDEQDHVDKMHSDKGDDEDRIDKAHSDKDHDEDTDKGGLFGSRHSVEARPSRKICSNILRYIETILSSIMVTFTRFLNRTSRDYRYIMKTLSVEKKILLMTHNFGTGMRTGPGQVWKPGPYIPATVKDKKADLEVQTDLEDITYVDETDSYSQLNMSVAQFEEEGELKAKDQSPFIRLILAMWFALLSHSELSCYIIIFLHQIYTPTVLTIPLPLMVFCWGTLTVPRPSKTFWVTIIAYTEVVVVIKCIFQFEFLYWNKKASHAAFDVSKIIGIEKKPGTYANFDLMVLLVVFFHRTMLKQLGLWRFTDPTRKSEPNVSATLNIEEKEENDKHMLAIEKIIKKREPSSSSSSSSTSTSSSGGSPIRFRKKKSVKLKTDFDTVSHMSEEDDKKKSTRKGPCYEFFKKLLDSKGRVTTDVYAYMFFFDFINFLIVIFGFSSFGVSQSSQGDGGVSQYFAENKVPVAFLIMLILQFSLIIIDRTLYLRKYILGKIVYQYIIIFGIHVWMFAILPYVTQRPFNSTTPPMLWYMCKCFYLLLSAYQIRCGYPTRIFGNFLCKSYNYINYILFKIFMTIPFVFELRTLMDWIWTDTSMTLSDWLKMEDIFAHVFQIKCQRRAESDYPQPRGEKKINSTKYLIGGGCLVAIIAVIWFPLVLFALGNTVGKPNLPSEVTISIKIGAFSPIYQITARNDSIFSFTEDQWTSFSNIYWKSRSAETFLSNYIFDDVGVVIFSPHSTVVWSISPPDNATMLSDLESNKTINIRLDWTITRSISQQDQPGTLHGSKESGLVKDDPARSALAKFLKREKNTDAAGLPYIFPKFLKVTNRGLTNAVRPLVRFDDELAKFDNASPFRTIEVTMKDMNNSVWWEVEENFTDPLAPFLKKLPRFERDKLVLYTFNDKAFPATLTIVSGKGIIGLYTTFVIVVHSIIRGFFTGISFKIMFDDMPNVDRILQTCLDIYLVRESRELDLEEDLFAKLVFLYRSPETLIKWTRPIEEAGDDDGDIPPAELNE